MTLEDRIELYYFMFTSTWRAVGISERDLGNLIEHYKLRIEVKLEDLRMTTADILRVVNRAWQEVDRAWDLENSASDDVYDPDWVIVLLGLIEYGRIFLNIDGKNPRKIPPEDRVIINPEKDVELSNKTNFGYCLDSCPECGKKRLVAVNQISYKHLYLKCKFCN